MEMNEMKHQIPVQMVSIPAPILTQLFFDVHYLADMHQNLIGMYERESALKKHHKAYLHVREEADAMCNQDKVRVQTILDHYENPGKHFEKAILFHEALMQDSNPFRKRGKHEKPEEEKKLDAFALPDGMVMMSTGTLGVMQDDMLALATVVDQLVAFIKAVYDNRACEYTYDDFSKLMSDAVSLSQDVFKRWDDADLAELN